MEKRKNAEAIVIVVLVVLLVGALGFMVWNMYFVKNETVISNSQANNSQSGSSNTDIDNVYKELRDEIASLKVTITAKDTEIANLKDQNQQVQQNQKNDVEVVEAVNYTYEKLKVKLPKIQNGGTNAEKLNKKILNEIVPVTYSRAQYNDDVIEYGKDGFTVKYDKVIKNNIIAIYVSIIENSGSEYQGTGDGIVRFNYFYDIKNDKELNFDDGVKKMGIEEYVIDNFLLGDLLLIENGKFLKEYKKI